eukprot:IDg22368t1
MRTTDFAAINRIRMMLVVSAAGDYGPTLFVFKGKTLPYRNVVRGGHVIAETYADYLPSNAVISTHAERGGVNADNYFQWARKFVEHISDLTAAGRKVLLVLDAYPAHMTMRVLEFFEKNNVVIYALPAHTSGNTQPCDVVLFGAFKRKLNESFLLAASTEHVDRFDTFEFCALMRTAFYAALQGTISAPRFVAQAFAHSTSQGFSPSLYRALPSLWRTSCACKRYKSSMSKKRNAVRSSILGSDARIAACGYLDTGNGLVLTSVQAMELAQKKLQTDNAKQKRKEIAGLRRAVAASKREESERADLTKRRSASWRTVPASRACP